MPETVSGRTDDPTDDVHDLISDTREDDRLLPQPGRPDFADQRVADRSEGRIVDQVEADQQDPIEMSKKSRRSLAVDPDS